MNQNNQEDFLNFWETWPKKQQNHRKGCRKTDTVFFLLFVFWNFLSHRNRRLQVKMHKNIPILYAYIPFLRFAIVILTQNKPFVNVQNILISNTLCFLCKKDSLYCHQTVSHTRVLEENLRGTPARSSVRETPSSKKSVYASPSFCMLPYSL